MSGPESLQLQGRVLFLSTDLEQVRAQMLGANFPPEQIAALRADVSTDEITPVAILSHYGEKLGQYPYTGLKVGDGLPIGVDAVRQGGFSVTVAGPRYGKGSSREHSPMAEKLAGIRLVIAPSFERIYRQNADNIGLFTSTDMGLVPRIQRGETITVEELVQGRDAVAAEVLRGGGLLNFGQRHLGGLQAAIPTAPSSFPAKPILADAVPEPQTLFEKIIRRHLLQTPLTRTNPQAGDGVFVQASWRFIHEYYTGMCAHMLHAKFVRPLPIVSPESVVVFEDHSSYVTSSPSHLKNGLVPNMLDMCRAQRQFVEENHLRCHRTLTDEEAVQEQREAPAARNVAGISHAMMIEHYALPGQVVVGTDSHTPHSGALGCAAFGVGTTDMANAFMTGAVRLVLPQSLRVELAGGVPAGITAKDVVLHLLAQPGIRAGSGVGKVFEFCGAAVSQFSIDERATLTNMSAELGGLTGIVAPDASTVAFLQERRGLQFAIEPWMHSDAGAAYAGYIRLDCSGLSPMVAAPGDPGNGFPLRDLKHSVRVDIAYGGSCTAGKREDFDHYHAVLKWALERGLRVPGHVRLYLQYGTTSVRDYCVAQGYDETFADIGAQILQPSCGACANCGPGSSTDAGQVTVSSINRNFPGRSGPGSVWLASPPTVMASALAGELVSFADLQKRFAA